MTCHLHVVDDDIKCELSCSSRFILTFMDHNSIPRSPDYMDTIPNATMKLLNESLSTTWEGCTEEQRAFLRNYRNNAAEQLLQNEFEYLREFVKLAAESGSDVFIS
jgi:hypothetical protein